MRKEFLSVLLLILSIPFIGGCKTSDSLREYFPLAVGNKWTWEKREITKYSTIERDGKLHEKCDTMLYFDTYLVIRKERMLNRDIFVVKSSKNIIKGEDKEKEIFKDDIFWVVYFDGELRWYLEDPRTGTDEFGILLRSPLEEGNSWEHWALGIISWKFNM